MAKQYYDKDGNAIKKKSWIKTALIVVLAIAILSAIFGNKDKKADNDNKKKDIETIEEKEKKGEKDTTTEVKEETEAETKKEDKEIKVGDKLAVGDGEFVVKSSEEKNEYKSNNQFIKDATTSGKFIEVKMNITNTGKKAKLFHTSYFKILDDKGREFETSNNTDLMMLVDSNLFLKEVNPGMSVEGILIFEVPADVNSYSIQYSELFKSGQIRIK